MRLLVVISLPLLLATPDPRRSGGPHYRTDWRAAGVGAAWGAGIGAVVGFALPYERWHRVIR
jgi:hypothetical protein